MPINLHSSSQPAEAQPEVEFLDVPPDVRKRQLETPPEASSASSADDSSVHGSPAVIDTLHVPAQSKGATEPPQRKRRVSTDSEVQNIPQANPIVKCITKPGKTTKKPQMKYDPDVPMTKEEAAIWRREQRRKRNRESAAASRQRQRDRITELETEVEQWKVKYDRIMRQVRELEQMSGARASSPAVLTARDIFHRRAPPPHPHVMHRSPRPHLTRDNFMHTPTYHPSKATSVITPPAAVHRNVTASDAHDDASYHGPASVSPFSSPAPRDDSSIDEHEDHIIEYHYPGSRKEYQHTTKMTSRPAVKITDAADAPAFPSLNSDDESLVPPDLCVSENAKLEPMDQALLEEAADAVLSATSSHTSGEPEEFGEFLLDAVDWL